MMYLTYCIDFPLKYIFLTIISNVHHAVKHINYVVSRPVFKRLSRNKYYNQRFHRH